MKSIKSKLLICVGIVVLSFSIIYLSRTYSLIKFNTSKLMHRQLSLALQFDLATRDYVAEKVRPIMYRLVKKDEFIPETMSASFVARNIFERVQKHFPEYIIKLSAKHPRNPVNKAGPQELQMIRYFDDNPKENIWTGEILMGGKKYLAAFSATRMKGPCLRCHGDPADAPASLLKIYGPTKGFHHQPGKVAGLNTIAIPTEKIAALLWSETAGNLALMGVEILFLFVSMALVLKFVITGRISKIARHFVDAEEQSEHSYVEPIEVEGRDEITAMVTSFNRLAAKHNDAYRLLEEKVEERTRELSAAVEQLENEVEERTRAKEALQKSEEFNLALIESLGDRIFAKDTEGRYTLMNRVSYDFWGIPYGSAIGKTDWEIHNEITAEAFTESDRVVLESGQYYSVEERVRTKDGRDIVLSVVKAPLRDKAGAIAGLVGISRDITEQKRTEEALRQSEENYRSIFENIVDVYYRADLDGNLIMVSPSGAELLGYDSVEEVIGKNIAEELYHDPEEREKLVKHLEEHGRISGFVVSLKRKDGTEIIAETNSHYLYDERGKPIAVEGILRDVTERRRAQDALAFEREQLLSIFESINEIIYVTDPETYEVLYVNQTLKDRFDKDPAGGKCYEEFQGLDSPCDFCTNDLILEKKGEPVTWEYHNPLIDGDYLITDRIIKWPDGRDVRFEVAIDITERKKAEEALRDSEERYRTLVSNIPGVVYRLERYPEWTCKVISDEIESISGYPASDFIGNKVRTCMSIVHPEDRENVERVERESVQKKRPYVNEYRIINAEGDVRWVYDKGQGIFDEAGELLWLDGAMFDITERKHAEEKLLAYQRQLRTMASEMSLVEERERRRIATGLHDRIGQALALSKIRLGGLKSSLSSTDFAESLEEILVLIEETIEETRSLTFELSPPVLYELGFEAAVEWLVEEFKKNNDLECELEVDTRPAVLDDDVRVLLFQAVRELLHNVVKHAKTQRAYLSIRKGSAQIRVEVSDFGVGFDVSSMETRADSSAGFGLFSIRERLEPLGGDIEIVSKPGSGTRVTVVAPVLASQE